VASQKPLRRTYGLTNTRSGIVGEIKVAAALARAGHNVAKPYWNDDEIDLMVLCYSSGKLVPIPVQVKSIQRDPTGPDEQATEGLRKKYLERQFALCLGIYCPQTDKVWFVDGAENIRRVHAEGVRRGEGKPGRPRKAYGCLGPDDDVAIYVNLTDGGDEAFDREWLIDPKYPSTLDEKVHRMRDTVIKTDRLTALIQAVGIAEPTGQDG